MPDEMVDNALGEILQQDEGFQILPISDCSRDEINQNSKRLIQQAAQLYLAERQVLQVKLILLLFIYILLNIFNTIFKNK